MYTRGVWELCSQRPVLWLTEAWKFSHFKLKVCKLLLMKLLRAVVTESGHIHTVLDFVQNWSRNYPLVRSCMHNARRDFPAL